MVEQAIFLGCGLAALGVTLFIIGAIQLRIPLESLRWPAAEGEVEQQESSGIRYRYVVRGKVYVGSRVSFRAEGRESTLRYSAGSTVKVFYDPARPDRAVLEPGAGISSYILFGAGGLLFVIGLIAGMFAFV